MVAPVLSDSDLVTWNFMEQFGKHNEETCLGGILTLECSESPNEMNWNVLYLTIHEAFLDLRLHMFASCACYKS